MTRPRRIVFWTVLSIFIASGLIWILSVPERPDRVYGAIPSGATLVSVHERFADEWRSIGKNPFMIDILSAAGVSADDIVKISGDPEVGAWIERLAPRRTLVAYVPSLGYRQKPAWVIASWIGGQSQRFRWQLQFFKSRQIRPYRMEHGGTIWRVEPRTEQQENQRLSLALADGMILACLSEDPLAVRWVLETADRYPFHPSIAQTEQPAKALSLLGGNPGPHWGWFEVANSADSSGIGGILAYTFNFHGSNELRGRIESRWALPEFNAEASVAQIASARKLFGESADMMLSLPISWIDAFLRRQETPWAHAMRDVLNAGVESDNRRMFVALMDRAHSGRLKGPLGDTLAALVKGLRVPTVIAGWENKETKTPHTGVSAALERLNAAYDLGLTAQTVNDSAANVALIEGTRDNFYGKFEPDERACAASFRGWTALSSHSGALKKLLKKSPDTEPSAAHDWQVACIEPGTAAFAWVDIPAASRTIKDALAVATLALMAANSPSDANIRDQVNSLRSRLSALDSLQTLSVSVKTARANWSADVILTRAARDREPAK